VTARLLGSLDVPGTPAAPAQARGYLRAVLGDGISLDDAILLVSELVTNSVRHSASGAGGTITVSVLEDAGGRVRVEVADQGGATWPAPRRPPDDIIGDLQDSGRGLFLVDRLSAAWGHFRRGARTTTWFVI
jgi:anti-sigma regulatory factor (Ser/Thr protein kinase)